MEEAAGVEWGHLRVVGKPPLLTGAAFGATPLLWVACRASPGLVHVFCDTHLLVSLVLIVVERPFGFTPFQSSEAL